jgi:hypothetical protein
MGRDSNFVGVTLLFTPDAVEAQEVTGIAGSLGQAVRAARAASFKKWESPDNSE